jgi:hemoglobin
MTQLLGGLAASILVLTGPAVAQEVQPPVSPPAAVDANAGAQPFPGTEMFEAFHGQAGIDRIVDDLVARNIKDPRIADIFKASDLARLRRTLKEQLCYILGGGCAYTGRDMKLSHADQGLTYSDFAALVENLQAAMKTEGVPFRVQNRLLARFAPMHRDMIER